MGYYINEQAEGFGIDVGVVFDVSGGYKWPFYTQNQYMATNPKIRFMIGGKSWVTIILYMLKLTVYLDVNGFDVIPFNYLVLLDIVNYQNVCHRLDWSSQGLSFAVNGQISVNECSFGALGIIIRNFNLCEWKNQFIDYPLYQVAYEELSYGGNFVETECYDFWTGTNSTFEEASNYYDEDIEGTRST